MEWSDLRIFLAISRAGTLGAAARALGLAQPTMGRRLRTLEAALNQSLFQRTTTGLLLTEEGNILLGHAERIEEEALAIERRIAAQSQQLDGVLRVTSSDWFGTHMLTPVLAEFAKRHPQVQVELITDSRFLNLSRREADLAFRIRPFDDADVVSRKLLHIPYGVYARKGSKGPRASHGRSSKLIALDAAFAGTPDDSWLQTMLPKAPIVFRSNSRDVQAKLCALGLGLAVLPLPLGDATPGIVRLNLGSEPPGRDTWIGYHRDLRRLPRLRALLDMVIARLAS